MYYLAARQCEVTLCEMAQCSAVTQTASVLFSVSATQPTIPAHQTSPPPDQPTRPAHHQTSPPPDQPTMPGVWRNCICVTEHAGSAGTAVTTLHKMTVWRRGATAVLAGGEWRCGALQSSRTGPQQQCGPGYAMRDLGWPAAAPATLHTAHRAVTGTNPCIAIVRLVSTNPRSYSVSDSR